MFIRFIPTPSRSSVGLGPLTVHFYALCILLGIAVAIAVGKSRYKKLGGSPSEVYDLAIFVIPAGIIGGRLYHVITTPELYFGRSGNFSNAFRIWNGGMGIWGAVALGTLVSYIFFKVRPRSLGFAQFADAIAPGLLFAQAIGRCGNWFNGELFGQPSTLPWALSIPLRDRPAGFEQFATFTPTFLYEALWCLASGFLLLGLPALKKLRAGNTFLLYIATYCAGRIWIEALRIDDAHHFLGIRLNDWVAGAGFLASVVGLTMRSLISEHVS